MAEHQIAEVPERVWLAANKRTTKNWNAEYNVAGWVNVIRGEGNFTLVARYQEGGSTKEVVVDTASSSGSGALLLSGKVAFALSSKVKDMVLVLKTPDASARFIVDELYMQDVKTPQNTQSKLVAAY